ncbi:MAG: hypothetical protein HY314_16745 [Acidobacteria bacterium]|nr:hypothetical protein [Acidobacteriota bacterium]
MKCREFKKLASSYVDDQLQSRQRRAFALHRAQCEACGSYLRQIRNVSESLSRLSRIQVPPELLSGTLVAFDYLRQERATGAAVRVANWAHQHSRMVSAVASFLITILCYGGILGQLKPIPYLPAFTHSESIKLSPSQFNRVNGLLDSVPGAQSYTFPRVRQTGMVDSPLLEMGNTSVVVLALVHPDGRASLVEILEPRGTPQMVQQVQGALGTLRFRPAMAGGRAVPTQLVLRMERIDIRG